MSINKEQVTDLHVGVDFLYSGCVSVIAWRDKDGARQYHISQNRKFLSIRKYERQNGWKKIISEDLTKNPLQISDEELLLVEILPGLNDMERALYRYSQEIVRAWEASSSRNISMHEINAQEGLKNFILNYVEVRN